MVLEFDGAGRLGADSVIVSNFATALSPGDGGVANFTASWAVGVVAPNILLEFTDGTFGTLEGGWPAASTSSTTYNSGSTPDEHALQFDVPFDVKCDGAWAVLNNTVATADCDIVLYQGTTVLASGTVDGNVVAANATNRLFRITWPEINLTTGTTYYLSAKPTTANSIALVDWSVSHVDHWQAHQAPTSWQYITRTNAGAWDAPDPLKRPFAGIHYSAIDFPAGGSAGLLTHPGMNGGMI